MSSYPEHEKLSKIKDQSQAIGEFIEWLNSAGYVVAEWIEVDTVFGKDSELASTHLSINQLLAKYFEIDQNKLEEEKRAILLEIRKVSQEKENA